MNFRLIFVKRVNILFRLQSIHKLKFLLISNKIFMQKIIEISDSIISSSYLVHNFRLSLKMVCFSWHKMLNFIAISLSKKVWRLKFKCIERDMFSLVSARFVCSAWDTCLHIRCDLTHGHFFYRKQWGFLTTRWSCILVSLLNNTPHAHVSYYLNIQLFTENFKYSYVFGHLHTYKANRRSISDLNNANSALILWGFMTKQ